jgi:ABC-type branched-subunit amino acid transport system substrate-binding protein
MTDRPLAAGNTIGSGPVTVAMLLPLSGELANIGTSMANAAQMAMDFVAGNPNLGQNITLVLKDSGSSPAEAAARASEAVSEGARLILGPLRGEQVTAVAAVARPAGLNVIAFSNNSGAAAPGVFLLNVLPEAEVRRTLRYASSKGRRAFAGLFPTNVYGRIQEGAFRQAVADLGLTARAVYSFGDESQARSAVDQLLPLIKAGQIDAVFIPDRLTAPSFSVMFEQGGVDKAKLTLIGSADWQGDGKIAASPFLSGAIYPAVDEAGFNAMLPDYQQRFGTRPHPFATIAYTAVVLASNSGLALGTPPYDRAKLSVGGGFNGRDGVFRFKPDGRSDYALVIRQLGPAGSSVVDGPKL